MNGPQMIDGAGIERCAYCEREEPTPGLGACCEAAEDVDELLGALAAAVGGYVAPARLLLREASQPRIDELPTLVPRRFDAPQPEPTNGPRPQLRTLDGGRS